LTPYDVPSAANRRTKSRNSLPDRRSISAMNVSTSVTRSSADDQKLIGSVATAFAEARRDQSVSDEYVIGQKETKKQLAVAVYQQLQENRTGSPPPLMLRPKSNIVSSGQRAQAKRCWHRTLARMLSVPFTIVDATTLTEAGYVGEDVENIILKLLQASNGDVERSAARDHYIDEIDKICRKDENPSITRDVSASVPAGALEDSEGTIPTCRRRAGRKHPHQEFFPVDTTKHSLYLRRSFRRTGKR